MRNNKTAIVILNFNGWQDTQKCLAALSKQTVQDFEIYLIDNGSKDESVKELSKIKMPNLHFHKEKKNTGFTGGVNIGIKWAIKNNFENVVLLNNDANAEPEWLENLLKPLEKSPEIGAVTSLMLDKTGKFIDDAGDVYSTWGIPMLRNEGEPKKNAPKSGLVFGGTGGATLYRTKVFKTIGFFDEDFFAYNEDVGECSLRVLKFGMNELLLFGINIQQPVRKFRASQLIKFLKICRKFSGRMCHFQ